MRATHLKSIENTDRSLELHFSMYIFAFFKPHLEENGQHFQDRIISCTTYSSFYVTCRITRIYVIYHIVQLTG